MLPMGLGYVEGVTHDYRRHGSTTLFAALDTAKGKVLTQCRPRHRHQEYPVEPDLHLIEPRGIGRSEVHVESWSYSEPTFYSRVFVRSVVVHDDVHMQCFRHILFDLS